MKKEKLQKTLSNLAANVNLNMETVLTEHEKNVGKVLTLFEDNGPDEEGQILSVYCQYGEIRYRVNWFSDDTTSSVRAYSPAIISIV
jgi:hypothetical protein